MVTPNRPYYLVEKQVHKHAKRWRVTFYPATSNTGSVIGHWPSKKEALLTTRLLAGRKAEIVIWKGL